VKINFKVEFATICPSLYTAGPLLSISGDGVAGRHQCSGQWEGGGGAQIIESKLVTNLAAPMNMTENVR
jgi:hypothetical protein